MRCPLFSLSNGHEDSYITGPFRRAHDVLSTHPYIGSTQDTIAFITMSSQTPQTPTRSIKRVSRLCDPEKTPTGRRSRRPETYSTLSRRNSFEDQPVHSLPDPRAPGTVTFLEEWKHRHLTSSQNAWQEFLPVLQHRVPGLLLDRFCSMLQCNAEEGTITMERILEEACALFGNSPDLVHRFNPVLPPGYHLETHEQYVAVFTPSGGWNEYPDRQREFHARIASSLG
ncbi:hypothetical protein C8Q78DRAFT_605349 [Trametes maxima]|nr:hypothetical protein C8Q78DRAFT_605349 [Trametes maxima]